MITLELKNYVSQSLSKGMPEVQIRQNLYSQGWTPEDLDEAFKAMGHITPTPAPTHAGIPTTITPIEPSVATPVATTFFSGKIIALIIAVVLAVGGGASAYWYFVLRTPQLPPTVETPATLTEQTPTNMTNTNTQPTDLQDIRFSIKVADVSNQELALKEHKLDDVLTATLKGNLYNPTKSLPTLPRANTNISTPIDATVAYFSAQKSGDINWISSLWRPEERQGIIDKYERADALALEKYTSVGIKAVVYYKDYVFVVSTFQPNFPFWFTMTFQKTPEGWLATNAASYIGEANPNKPDLTWEIISSVVVEEKGTMEVVKSNENNTPTVVKKMDGAGEFGCRDVFSSQNAKTILGQDVVFSQLTENTIYTADIKCAGKGFDFFIYWNIGSSPYITTQEKLYYIRKETDKKNKLFEEIPEIGSGAYYWDVGGSGYLSLFALSSNKRYFISVLQRADYNGDFIPKANLVTKSQIEAIAKIIDANLNKY